MPPRKPRKLGSGIGSTCAAGKLQPKFVVEVGFSERYEDLVEDVTDPLLVSFAFFCGRSSETLCVPSNHNLRTGGQKGIEIRQQDQKFLQVHYTVRQNR